MKAMRYSAPLIAGLLLLAACQGASPSASSGGSVAASPSASASAGPSLPDFSGDLTVPGKLVICSDIPYPPQEFFDADNNPIGSDIEIGQEIATRLGLEAEIKDSVFDTIIASVTSGVCDIVISAQNITDERTAQVDMIPYFQAGQSFVVAKGNPKGIHTQDDLCGKTVAAETGTTEIAYLEGTGDYAGNGLSAACVAKGLAEITITQPPKDSDALAALISGNADAYFADSPVAGYYTVQQPENFELSGLVLDVAKEGISVPKPHTALRDAIVITLVAMINDGAYGDILTKYGVADGGLQASDIVVNQQ